MTNLTEDEYRVFTKGGYIPLKYREREPTLHFCNEWDGMLIDKTDPEFEVCLCYAKQRTVD